MAFADLRMSLSGWGTARADLASIGPMRKALPPWAAADIPGHFLKHADEQTVLAVAAVDQAIRASDATSASYADWAIIAAPRFIGRIAGVATLERFSRGGGPAISPHVIPQHSLHSVAGALSILLGSRKPNFGVGGAGDALAESLLAALTFAASNCQGVWLVATAWDPEPQLDDQGQCLNQPVCYAAALALQTAATAATCGTLQLHASSLGKPANSASETLHAAELCRQLTTLVPGGPPISIEWNLSWGGTLVLSAAEKVKAQSLAA